MNTYGLIHLSDIHIGETKNEAKHAGEIVRFIGSVFPKRPVLVTGDITDSGTEKQFTDARKLFDRLALTNPVLLVPGNHDYAYIGNFCHKDAWQNWIQLLGSPLGWGKPSEPWLEKEHEPIGVDGLGVWRDGDIAFFGIDSGDPGDEVSSARGFISEGLATALKTSLEQHQGKIRIAMLHHHPFTSFFFTALKGAKLLMDALSDNCELLLFGHDHNYGIWKQDPKTGIPLVIASHKSTKCLSGKCGMITLIDIKQQPGGIPIISHRLEVLPL